METSQRPRVDTAGLGDELRDILYSGDDRLQENLTRERINSARLTRERDQLEARVRLLGGALVVSASIAMILAIVVIL